MKRIIATGSVAALALVGFAGTASAEPMGKAKGKPAGIQCMQNGIATLQGAGLLNVVAKDGLDAGFALTPSPDGLGVQVRPGKEAEAAMLPATLPFSVVLADHRAGDDSILLYPWCD